MHPPVAVVVTFQNERWARLRVAGLLRNGALASWLESGAAGQLRASVDTGSVKVTLAGARDAQGWATWVCLRIQAGPRASVRPRPRAASLVPRARTVRARQGTAPPQATSAPEYHARPLDELYSALGLSATAQHGLDSAQAAERLRRDGPNEVDDVQARTPLQILLGQFRSVPIGLLAGSGALSLATRAFADAGAIAAVLAANGTLGYLTERRAEETVASLRQLGPRDCTVLRDGAPTVIDAREVVVGDVLLLKPGESIAADARVLEAHRLAVNEAALTGESLPERKEADAALRADAPLGERRNMVFLGTVVSGGAGAALVVATGERTALGRIRQLAELAGTPRTQLQQELDRLGQRLAMGAGGVCIALLTLGLLRRRPLLPLLRMAVSLGVAAIPEGLPTVATSLLASAIRQLRTEGIYARSLSAVESLGAIDTVCFDKTGTLTQNRMSLASITLGTRVLAVDDRVAPPALPDGWIQVAALCNTLEPSARGEGWEGSATELALLRFALAGGARPAALRAAHPLQEVRHRSEHHPYMVTIHRAAQGLLVAVKGRPDEVLARCTTWYDGRRVVRLTASARRALLALNERIAGDGQRVLALAWREHGAGAVGETGSLCWLGMAGLADALRPDLAPMMDRFRAAGVRPMMITGDQLPTAEAVARQVGLDGSRPMRDAAVLPEDAAQLRAHIEGTSGFARTSPAMKLQIVKALQEAGHVVAMTGDGINDGPALKAADVGVSMGVAGTEFAHAMSDLVLRDDDPAALLSAIGHGRTAFLNVRKALRYLVATNLSELAATALAVAAGREEPFDPLALLWTNIVTDIWPAIALGLEPDEPGLLERPPVSLRPGVLERGDWVALGTDASVMALSALASYGWGLSRYGPGPQARTHAFMTLTTSQLLYAFTMRSTRPLRHGGLQPNPHLRRAITVSLAAQAGTVLLPAARRLLRTTPLGPLDAVVVAATAALPLLTRELLKERGA